MLLAHTNSSSDEAGGGDICDTAQAGQNSVHGSPTTMATRFCALHSRHSAALAVGRPPVYWSPFALQKLTPVIYLTPHRHRRAHGCHSCRMV